MRRSAPVSAPPTPEWIAFVEHVADCEDYCRASQPCSEAEELLRAHLATRGGRPVAGD
ncbi:hypothetical protein ABZ341_39395 [Streptomyces sp. NPDC006173]|uniref:hypothetical protein n=1 Tax=Streptomyces sp. NPDC006173 TaxID=3155349 RepID=UPI00340AE0E1